MKAHTLLTFAALALAFSCAKEINNEGTGSEKPAPGTNDAITITASLPENGLTKVTFDPTFSENNSPSSMTLKWSEGDKIRISDHSDNTRYMDFALDASSIGSTSGTFTLATEAISAESYDATILIEGVDYCDQTQASDGSTSHLKFGAQVSEIDSYTNICFEELSSVLAITGLFSEGVAEGIKSIDIKAFNEDGKTASNIFNGTNSISIELESNGDADPDNYIHFFATLPVGSTDIADNARLVVHFNAPGTDHKTYTRYIELESSLQLQAGKLNTINVNASACTEYANTSTVEIGTETNPYLIGDMYQMKAIDALASSEKKHFSLIDDIDLKDAEWTSLNAAGNKVIDLDGNGFKVLNPDAPLFQDFNGTASDLTIENAVIAGSADIKGVFSCFIHNASSLDNIDIVGTSGSSSSISSSNLIGGLVGQIAAACTISNCDIRNVAINQTSTANSGKKYTGGLVGQGSVGSTYTNCTVKTAITAVTPGQAGIGGFMGRAGDGDRDEGGVSTFKRCSVLEGTTINSKGSWTGGFMGYDDNHCNYGGTANEDFVEGNGCSSAANITMNDAGEYTGGFVGFARGGYYTHCTASGTVSGKGANVGGFAGTTVGSALYNSSASGDVTSSATMSGGFVGLAQVASHLDNCSASGKVSSKSDFVGGFAGRFSGDSNATGCSYLGTMVTTSYGSADVYMGGFAGYIGKKDNAFTGKITSCLVYNKNGVEVAGTNSSKWVGGFTGGIGHSTTANNTGRVSFCRVKNVIASGAQYTGGFAGVSYSTTTNCCVEDGSVEGNGASCGGFIGYQQGNPVSYCFSTANVNAASRTSIGGLIGQAKGAKVSECYTTGNVAGSEGKTGGVIGEMKEAAGADKCIRWNHENHTEICGTVTSPSTDPTNSYVKTSEDNDFQTKAAKLGWSNDGTIWNYSGATPALVGVPAIQ